MYRNAMPAAMYGMGMDSNLYQGNYNTTVDQTKGKGKYKDADFEAAFAQVTASLSSTQIETPRIVEVENDVSTGEETLKNGTAVQDSDLKDKDSEFTRFA